MLKKKFLIFYLIFNISAVAQNLRIEKIIRRYDYVTEKIYQDKSTNSNTVNFERISIEKVSNSYLCFNQFYAVFKRINFYYTKDTKKLVFITVDNYVKGLDYSSYEEFLFDEKERLIYYFYKVPNYRYKTYYLGYDETDKRAPCTPIAPVRVELYYGRKKLIKYKLISPDNDNANSSGEGDNISEYFRDYADFVRDSLKTYKIMFEQLKQLNF